jgi:hypothetical protein
LINAVAPNSTNTKKLDAISIFYTVIFIMFSSDFVK